MTEIDALTIATELEAEIFGPNVTISGFAPLSEARARQLSFVTDPLRYETEFTRAATAGAVILAPAEPGDVAPIGTLILVENPRAAFGQVLARHFAPQLTPGIAATARVHPSAQVHESASIGEYTIVRAGAVVGAGVEIRDHVVIGHGVTVGEHSLIKSHAVIGEEGFGIEKDAQGNNFHIPHLGSVRLGAHCEVGNFTTVCSGTLTPTVVGEYTKIDDHVHVAHNCQIGKNVIIIACAEISGSVIIEDEAWIGPNTSVIQGITIGAGSLLGIGAVALKSVPENEVRVGNPAKRLGDVKK